MDAQFCNLFVSDGKVLYVRPNGKVETAELSDLMKSALNFNDVNCAVDIIDGESFAHHRDL